MIFNNYAKYAKMCRMVEIFIYAISNSDIKIW